MATYWKVSLVGAVPAGLERRIQALLDDLVRQMSQWEADSEISAYNRAPRGTWTPISADFAEVVRCALDLAALTEGAFDPALGAAVDAWGFGPPPPADVAGDGAGWREVAVGPQGLFQPGGVRLDLSGIAKGFAVDKTATLLAACGVAAFLVEIGGELCGRGLKPDGSPWWAQIEPPRESCRETIVVALPGWAVATSGDYRRRVERDGRAWSHTFDPAARTPLAAPPASVSVLAPDCMRADGWATALTVLGEAGGLALADAHDLPALFLLDRGGGVEARASAAWSRLWA
jgi:thiamine biosynthesis lipoprotein